MSALMSYSFTRPFPVVGTKEYFRFKTFVLINNPDLSSRHPLKSYKEEYLIEWYNEYLKINQTV